ncbi:MAG: SurA N-terminal domain-containing protein [Pyrinomonadaceae bacterium]
MLKFFKRMEKTRNFILILFSVLLVASLIIFGAMSRTQNPDSLGKSTAAAATVGNETITVADVVTTQENTQRMFGQAMPISAEVTVKQLIEQRLVRLEAAKLGLTASDSEVAARIRELFTPQDGKPFDKAVYEENAIRQSGSISAFENQIRDSVSRDKLVAFVTSGVSVSEADALEKYLKQNTKFDLSYVSVNAADIAQNLKPSDDELKAYFEKNKKDYFIAQDQKKVKYIYLSTSKVGEKLSFTDKELEDEFNKLPEDRKRAGVKVQELVLRVPKPEFEAETIAKANRIIQDLKKDKTTISEDDFAKAAQGQSENAATAADGGRVNGLVRPAVDPSKQDDPYQRVLNMKEGEITEPIQYKSRVYILRRGESVAKKLEDAKKEIEVSLRNRKAYAANAELAGKVAAELKKSKDVEATAEKFASEANSSSTEMIRETGYVVPGTEVKDIGISQDFENGIAPLAKANDVGEKIPVPGGFAIPMVVDIRKPRDAEFEDVRAKVSDAYKVSKAREEMEAVAKAIASGAGSASGLSGAASAKGLKALEAKDFTTGSPLGEGPNAAVSSTLDDAIYKLKAGDVTSEPVKVGDNYIIVGATARKDADKEDFTKEKDRLMEEMAMQEKDRVFRDYMASVRRRYEAEKKIVIYKEEIAKIDSFNQQNQPPAPPQQPGGQQLPPELLEQLQKQAEKK